MNTKDLKTGIAAALTRLKDSAEELRDLDAALGDGDLGITISSGAEAVVASLRDLDESADASAIARACAKAFANANPSTMAALVAGALLAGSKAWSGKTELTYDDMVVFASAAAESISVRGKSKVGDKTILDALVPAVDAFRSSSGVAAGLHAAITAARRGVEDTRELQSLRGRAAWLQERSKGLQDPGATAFLRFLEAWPQGV